MPGGGEHRARGVGQGRGDRGRLVAEAVVALAGENVLGELAVVRARELVQRDGHGLDDRDRELPLPGLDDLVGLAALGDSQPDSATIFGV